MIYIGDDGLSDELSGRIVGGSVSSCAWRPPERAGSVRRPEKKVTGGPLMGHRNRDKGSINCQDPRAVPDRRWSCGRGGVNVELGGGRPGSSASGFGKGNDTHVPSREGGEGRRLEAVVIDPCSDGDRGEVRAISAA